MTSAPASANTLSSSLPPLTIYDGVQSLTDSYLAQLNAMIETVGGRVDTSDYQSNVQPGHYAGLNHAYFAYKHSNGDYGEDKFKVVLGHEQNSIHMDTNEDASKIMQAGLEYEFMKLKFHDGDLIKLRAFEA